jgi:hypothetical protein
MLYGYQLSQTTCVLNVWMRLAFYIQKILDFTK